MCAALSVLVAILELDVQLVSDAEDRGAQEAKRSRASRLGTMVKMSRDRTHHCDIHMMLTIGFTHRNLTKDS
ncbi:hypothetical protein N7475_004746 [Penicillium sp. IBT 31633x]|nr:hypothetical protein N7475_004746 [Penicillium sp. IBT 31633x]